jgi:biotin carboxyl carrier protein
MLQRKWIPRVLILVLALAALVVAAAVMAQRPQVLARAAIAGEVVAEHLVEVGQVLKQGDPLVYVRSPIRSGPALAAVAPADGRVTRVTVRPGSNVNIGDIVAVIQPL